jgi:hypothetical protein
MALQVEFRSRVKIYWLPLPVLLVFLEGIALLTHLAKH